MIKVQDDISIQDLQQDSGVLFQKIYEENRAKFLNFARKYKLPEADNIDVYQDAYIVFYNNVKQGKIKEFTSSISTYIFGVGKYMIFDKMKKNNKTWNPDFDLSVLQEKENLLDENIEIDEKELTVEQQLLKKHFSGLGKKCQELLNLFYYRGFTIKDIIATGAYTSENVVKSAKSRCMKTLRERIIANH
ncbi:MAG: sigma-70 family RNA polymerase sigma factor [Oceanihabitans sp.]